MNCLVKRCRQKFLLLCLLLVAIPGMMAHAQQSQLPEMKISLSLQNESLAVLFKKIEQASGYLFTYDKTIAEKHVIASASWKDSPMKTVLGYVKDKYGASFTVDGKSIAVSFPSGKSRITGAVVDEATGDALVNVTVSAGSASSITDAAGNYLLNIQPGNYTLRVSNVGYQAKQISDVLVKPNEATLLNVTMAINSGKLQEVVVSTSLKRESVAALYVRQKNAPAISDGISAEQIARTPDKNVGETLKRVSGVATLDNRYVVVRGLGERYNQTLLNGQIMPSTELNRKQFSFDVIPSNLVDNIVVYKTITADQSAEFGGGSVEVNTKSIPAENFLTVTAGTSVNDQTTGKPFRSLKLEGREYFGQVSKHRYLFGTLDWQNAQQVADKYASLNNDAGAFNNNWGLHGFNAHPSQNYQVSLGRVMPVGKEQKLGITASVSYRNTLQTDDIYMSRDGFLVGTSIDSFSNASFKGKSYNFITNIGAIGGIGYAAKGHKISFQTLFLRTLDQRLILGMGYHNDQDGLQMGYYDLTTQTQMWQNQLKGEHTLGKKGIRFNWATSYMLIDRHRPDNHQLKADLLQDSSIFTSDEYNISTPYSSGISEGVLRWWTRAKEKNLFWDASISIPFKLTALGTAVNNTFKTGYAGWSKDRFFYVLNTGSKMFDAVYYPPLSNAFDSGRGGQIYLSQFGDDFHRTAALHASFLMLDHKIGKKWRLVWGVRGEYYNLNKVNAALDSVFRYINYTRGADKQFDYSLLKSREKNLNFFPSANLTYSLNKKMNLRLAYAKSIIRPDLRETSFFSEYDFELGGTYNGDLIRSTLLDHYDFRYEWYPGAGEVLSFSLFYKKIKYPIEIFQGDFRQFFMRNNKSAENKGLEVEVRKSLSFLGLPVLKNLMIYGNFTMLDGSVIPMYYNYNRLDPVNQLKILPEEQLGPKQDRLQVGASEYMFNGGVYYDTKPVSLSLTYNWVSERLIRPSEGTDLIENLYEKPMKSLDAQVAARFLEQKLEVKCNVSNLLNSTSTMGQPVTEFERITGRTCSISATYRF